MGLLDIFKRKENNIPKVNYEPRVEQQPSNVNLKPTKDGRLQVDFYDSEAEFRKFYDTTRLIVKGIPLNIEGQEVYECEVSWYGQNDCQMFHKETGEFSSLRAINYREVLAQIDLDLLQNDPNYCQILMKGLLDKDRVEKYLENGLQETPQTPCGKYIGGIQQTEYGYIKIFSQLVGQASHNSRSMVNKRQERRKQIEDLKRREIDNKKAQIAKLQSEIDDMSR